MPDKNVSSDGYILDPTPAGSHMWSKIFSKAGNVTQVSGAYPIPEYAKFMYLKAEYGANTGTSNFIVYLKDVNDVWLFALNETATNTALDGDAEEGSGWYHAVFTLGLSGYKWRVPVEPFTHYKIRTTGHASGVSAWVMFV